jgi:hypothetical protein
MRLWFIVASPFIFGGVIVATIKACEWWDKFSYERARRIRNENMRKFGLVNWKNPKDGFLS